MCIRDSQTDKRSAWIQLKDARAAFAHLLPPSNAEKLKSAFLDRCVPEVENVIRGTLIETDKRYADENAMLVAEVCYVNMTRKMKYYWVSDTQVAVT